MAAAIAGDNTGTAAWPGSTARTAGSPAPSRVPSTAGRAKQRRSRSPSTVTTPAASAGAARHRSMPRYEYQCEACNRTVTLRLSISQHEKARQACPKCGSTKLTQLVSSFLTQTSRKA